MKLTRPLLAIDTETTGTDVARDRVVQIAVVTLKPTGQCETQCRLINPGRPIPPEATEVHGHTDDAVKDAPTFQQIAKSLADLLSGADITGYNARAFDLPILSSEFRRCGITWPDPGTRVVDSFEIFKRQEPHRLDKALAFYTGETLEGAHDAAADAKAALDVLIAQASRYGNGEALDLDELDQLARDPDWVDAAGRSKWVGDVAVINFGRHEGTPLERVPGNYLDWILAKDFPNDFKELCHLAKLRQLPRRPEYEAQNQLPW